MEYYVEIMSNESEADSEFVYFSEFDEEKILQTIITAIQTGKWCEYGKKIAKWPYMEAISHYDVNPNNGKPSKIVCKGQKEYYIPLTLN